MYVTRDSHKFLARFLIQECYNRQLCEEIILAVTDPLIKATDSSPVENNHMNFCKPFQFAYLINLLMIPI